MPKLDAAQILERLQNRLEELEAGKEIPAKDIRALLKPHQLQQLETAWQQQEQLRTQHRARTEEEKQALGWKTKREVRIEIFKSAIKEAQANMLNDLHEELRQKQIKQTRVYFDALGKALDEGKEPRQARNEALAAQTRAHLPRMDGADHCVLTERDKEVKALEDEIKATIRANMTPHELEQLEILEEHEARARKLKK
jgi:hypothetical protein